MNYKLAKQLKDAGFKQGLKEGDAIYRHFFEREYAEKLVAITDEETKKREDAIKVSSCAYIIPGLPPIIEIINGVKYERITDYSSYKKINARWEMIIVSYDEDCDEWWEDISSDEYVKVPTLQELIKACGEELDSLTRFDGGWTAQTFDSGVIGNTPEEAVAKLWLKLNK